MSRISDRDARAIRVSMALTQLWETTAEVAKEMGLQGIARWAYVGGTKRARKTTALIKRARERAEQ